MCLLFVTSNEHKFHEVSKIFSTYNIKICWHNLKYLEIQDDNLEKIAVESAKTVYKLLRRPFFLEDTGLFIDALKGFPGPYSAYVFKTIGCNGILRLMQNIDNRHAYFKTVVAFIENESHVYTFIGKKEGSISLQERGTAWGYDPIFIPKGYTKTYAELGHIKNQISHRVNAMKRFIDWYIKNILE
ncbi:MAG: XTP/dITP diphosphatase [Candidatus Odinarchaeota archaeon]|nr:XTP/dITP diphosphatase [Candidatus Odinarchaeota archaeon]